MFCGRGARRGEQLTRRTDERGVIALIDGGYLCLYLRELRGCWVCCQPETCAVSCEPRPSQIRRSCRATPIHVKPHRAPAVAEESPATHFMSCGRTKSLPATPEMRCQTKLSQTSTSHRAKCQTIPSPSTSHPVTQRAKGMCQPCKATPATRTYLCHLPRSCPKADVQKSNKGKKRKEATTSHSYIPTQTSRPTSQAANQPATQSHAHTLRFCRINGAASDRKKALDHALMDGRRLTLLHMQPRKEQTKLIP